MRMMSCPGYNSLDNLLWIFSSSGGGGGGDGDEVLMLAFKVDDILNKLLALFSEWLQWIWGSDVVRW